MRRARRPGRTDASARAATRRSSRACGRNAWPSMVSWTPRAVRVNRRTSRSFSSAAMRLEAACWVTDSAAAASANWPASAAATKVRTASISTRQTLPTQLSVVARRYVNCLLCASSTCLDRTGQRRVVARWEVRSLMARRSMGRQFGWLWAAYAVSAYGSGLGFGAFPLIAVLVLHAGPAQVSALSAIGPAVGALIALPLGPWVEFRRKRPVMIGMDLARFAIMVTIPVAYAFGRLSYAQLLTVSAVVAAAKIAFNAASGSYLRALVRPDDLLVASARFESTNWSSIAVGPPLGGAAIGLFGPVTTVVADSLSYLFSALGITAIRGQEEPPQRAAKSQVRAGELLDGWRHIVTHRGLRAL